MRDRAFWAPLAVYLAIAIAGAWAVTLPLLASGAGRADPLFGPLTIGATAAPMLAAFVTAAWVQRYPVVAAPGTESIWGRLGLSIRPPYRRLAGYFVLAWLGAIALTVLALVTSAAFGGYRFDLQGLSGLRALLADDALLRGDDAGVTASAHEVLFAHIVSVVFFSLLAVIPALGEEIGWRGWLAPHVAPLGPARSVLFGGVAWALARLPLAVVGYTYAGSGSLAALGATFGSCVLLGALLGWVRLRSESVWPAAVGLGALNASTSLAVVLGDASKRIDMAQVTVWGVAGWVTPALLVAIVWWRGGFRPRVGAAPGHR